MKHVLRLQVFLLAAITIGACATAAAPDISATMDAEFASLRETILQQQQELDRARDQLTSAQASQIQVTRVAEVAAEEPVEAASPATPVPPPTPVSEERSKILLFGSYGGHDARRFTKLEALAFTNDLDLLTFPPDGRKDFNVALDQPDVKLVIYTGIYDGGVQGLEADLLEMAEFVEGGGRILILTQHWWAGSNSLFQRLFGVSLVQEEVLNTNNAFFFSNESLPHYMDGLDIGYAQVQINHYLATNVEGGESRYLRSDVSGDDRLWYYSSTDRSVTIMVGSVWPTTNLFDDQAVDFSDNEQAALNLLSYLMGG